MRDHVFVSDARADKTYAEGLAAHLRAHGVEVWTDAVIDCGAEWLEAIQEKIDSCAAFVVVMSSAARQSAWVRQEVLHASRLRVFADHLGTVATSRLPMSRLRGVAGTPPRRCRATAETAGEASLVLAGEGVVGGVDLDDGNWDA